MSNKWYIKKVTKELEDDLEDKLEVIGTVLEGEAKLNIDKLKAVRTRRLRDSIDHEMIGKDTVIIGTDVEYASFVELGTVKQKPKPFLLRTLKENRKKVKEILKR